MTAKIIAGFFFVLFTASVIVALFIPEAFLFVVSCGVFYIVAEIEINRNFLMDLQEAISRLEQQNSEKKE